MINVVIVDDEILVLNFLKKLLIENGKVNIIGEFTDPSVALEEIPKLNPNVIFLDVEMPKINGVEMSTKLLKNSSELDIVFVTAHEKYAIEAFKLNAIHYILKPPDLQSIDETIKRIIEKRGYNKEITEEFVNICLFGDVCVFKKESNEKVKWITSKVEELFALLMINREKGVSKWKIMDVLWEETEMVKSQQNLYTTIFRLKKTLRDAGIKASIENNVGVYRMNLEDIICDLTEFETIINKKIQINKYNISEFEKAITLYQGDLFGDRDYRWSIVKREACYDSYVELIKKVASYYVENNLNEKLDKLIKYIDLLIEEEDNIKIKEIFFK